MTTETARRKDVTKQAAALIILVTTYYFGSIFQLARRTFWTTGLGDWRDPYFINFLLEHWYHSLRTFSDPSSPPMFTPVQGTLGYSHGLVLYAPIYFMLRPFFHPFQSYGLTLFIVLQIGAVSLFLLLRLVLRLSFVEAIVLTVFFLASRNVVSGVLGVWSQRASVFLIPPILLLLFLSRRVTAGAARAVLAALAGLFTTLLFTHDFYTAALATLVAILGFAPMAIASRAPLVAALTQRQWIGPFALGASLGMLIFTWIYLPAYRQHPAFSSGDVMNALVSNGFVAYDSAGSFVLVLVLAALTWTPSFRADRDARRCSLWFMSFSVLVLLIPIRFGDFSIWMTLFRPVPGLAAIRDPKRIIYMYDLAVVLAVGLLLGRMAASFGLRLSAVLLMLVLLIAAPNRTSFDFLRPNATYDQWVEAPIDVDPSCRSFFIARASQAYARRLNADSTAYDIDAMFVAVNHSIPTLNGYSAWTPEGWRLSDPSDPGYSGEVVRWIDRYALKGVCEFDVERRTMTPRR